MNGIGIQATVVNMISGVTLATSLFQTIAICEPFMSNKQDISPYPNTLISIVTSVFVC